MTNPTVPKAYTKATAKQVAIGRHVIIGSGTIILPGVTLGEGCSIGAFSLVRKSVEPWTICAGNPCVYIKDRSKELLKLETLLEEDRKGQ